MNTIFKIGSKSLPYVCETFIDKSSATKFAKIIEVELDII